MLNVKNGISVPKYPFFILKKWFLRYFVIFFKILLLFQFKLMYVYEIDDLMRIAMKATKYGFPMYYGLQ